MTEKELLICERFSKIRAMLGMKQGDFANELKLTQGHVSDIENKRKGVSDRVIEILCLKFNISETWLRTGEGEMKASLDPDDRLSINLSKLGRSENEFIQNAVNALAESDPDKLLIIEDFMRQCLGLKKEQD